MRAPYAHSAFGTLRLAFFPALLIFAAAATRPTTQDIADSYTRLTNVDPAVRQSARQTLMRLDAAQFPASDHPTGLPVGLRRRRCRQRGLAGRGDLLRVASGWPVVRQPAGQCHGGRGTAHPSVRRGGAHPGRYRPDPAARACGSACCRLRRARDVGPAPSPSHLSVTPLVRQCCSFSNRVIHGRQSTRHCPRLHRSLTRASGPRSLNRPVNNPQGRLWVNPARVIRVCAHPPGRTVLMHSSPRQVPSNRVAASGGARAARRTLWVP